MYTAHTQTYGWNAPAGKNGTTAGTTGQGKRMEAITAKVTGGTIEYRGHVQGIGWESKWSRDGAVAGTTGQYKRLEAIEMRMVGGAADKGYHVWYRVHSQKYGWLGWTKDGEPAGTSSQSLRAEAYQVVVLADGVLPAGYDATKPAFISNVFATPHVQRDGWHPRSFAGLTGTTGQAKRLEALRLEVADPLVANGITYSAHLQGIGWTGERSNGQVVGTTGQQRRLEAVRIRLTGPNAAKYSVWYRMHVQTYGWLGWTRDGGTAGTTGLARRGEAVDILVLPKGTLPPGYDGRAAYRSK